MAPTAAVDDAPEGALTRPRTVAELPFFAAGRFPKPDLVGRSTSAGISRITGRELVEVVRDVSLGLTAEGLTPGDRVAIFGESRPEWLVSDLAILTAGGVTTPIYPTATVDQISHILKDAGVSVAVVSSAPYAEKIVAAARSLPSLRQIVVWDDAPPSEAIPVLPFDEVKARGHRRILDGWGVAREFQAAAKAISPEALAAIVYTSGTTGTPRGVRLSHGNLMANVSGVLDVLDLNPDDTGLSFLPLCHAFERIVAFVYLTSGVSMIFAESIDTVPRDLRQVRPTVMSGVPRVFEKLYARVRETAEDARGLKRRVIERALAAATAEGASRAAGVTSPLSVRAASFVGERAVYGRVRDAVGGRLRFAVSGSAPLNPVVGQFFLGLGIPIYEGYGLTEAAPVLTVMPQPLPHFGSVGRALPNVELKIADDGEVLARGPNVMQGYHGRPEESAAMLAGGWLHTGDIGELDAEGYLRLTDRKKDLLVTSGGKKIPPQPIEERLRAHPLVEDAMLVGDGRHFPAALIVPDLRVLARQLKCEPAAASGEIESAAVRALYQEVVDSVNEALAQYERVKKFVVLTSPFSVATGELTATLKVKRQVVAVKFAHIIEALYR